MSRGYSCYLDLARVIACIIVYFHHLTLDFGCYEREETTCRALRTLFPYHAGHSAVIIFFVLSGCVITYVASEREITFRDYALSRFARIYSVALPALLLAMLVDTIFFATGNYEGIPVYQYRKVWAYLLLDLTFTTDHWFISENAFSNGGWWSLSYEVWYYVLFAAAFYARGWQRWISTTLVMLCMGPKLWALLLPWLLGSAAYRLQRRTQLGPRLATAFVIGTLSAIVFGIESDAFRGIDRWADGLSAGWLSTHMRFSQWFVGDTLLAILFAASVFAAKFAPLDFGVWHRPIKYLASFTFTFYLVHGLILRSCITLFGLGMVPTTLALIGFVFLFGLATEHQKDRLHGLLAAMLSALNALLRRWRIVGLRG